MTVAMNIQQFNINNTVREKWWSKLKRMVLDASITKNDYGALNSNASMKTQDNIYQREPLLKTVSHEITIDDSEDENDAAKCRLNGTIHREAPKFPKEVWKTFIAFMMMAVGMTLNTAVLSMVHDRVPNIDVASRNVSRPLPDIILDNIPYNDTWALDTSEIIIMISVNTCFFVVCFHKHRFIVARRIFLIMSWLYLVRCVTMFVTVLPVASFTYECSPKSPHPTVWLYLKRTWQLFTGFGLTINGKHTYCGDYIYSGHTLILVMANLIITEYTPSTKKIWVFFHWLSWCASVFGVICVLYARAHYTVDIIIAYYITTRSFWIYHHLADNKRLVTTKNKKTSRNHLAKICWYPVFTFFEKNINGIVPLEYDWPLPWPRRKHPNRNS